MGRFFILLALVVAPASARADDIDPGYVETCSLAATTATHPTEECIACAGSAPDGQRCAEELRRGGYAPVCRTRGASHWTEVGCRARAGASGCTVGGRISSGDRKSVV
jgi:hypothetical protein